MSSTKPQTVLAIDTSCDETAVAVVKGVTVCSNIIASQVELHKEYGGVFPTVAKQAHKEQIEPCVQAALKRAKLDLSAIDLIAVTQGPGLAPALEVGILYAHHLATRYSKPIVAVNHIEGHLVSVLAKSLSRVGETTSFVSALTSVKFPALSIIVSGGHTEFILIEKLGEYKKIGNTIDDAAGEALDKIGRMLNLGYPAGPVLEQFAKQGDPHKYKFPLPMTTSGDYNLSFSGLKTFARNLLEKEELERTLKKQDIYDLAASVQFSIFRHIIHKLNKILKDYPHVGEVWLGGGVAANATLRAMLRTELHRNSTCKLRVPYSKRLCGDNAAMIGIAAQLHEPTTRPIDRKPRWEVGT